MIIGIDLGTSNSLVSYIKDGSPRIIPNERGERMTPSVVCFKNDSEIIVGQMAKNQVVLNSDNTVSLVKLSMGKDKVYTINSKTHTPADVSGYILKHLKKMAESYLGQPVCEAVITVPAYFNDRQREDTINAAHKAGLKVLRLLNEPTAAALVYGFSGKIARHLLVIDLGGGTFDITLMNYENDMFRVMGVGGSTGIGGWNFDQTIVAYMVKEFEHAHGMDLTHDKIALQQLVIHAEKAKIDLSSTLETQIMIPYIAVTSKGPIHLKQVLTRNNFYSLIAPILDNIGKHIWQTFKESGLKPSWVDSVIMVGGSTRIPALADLVKRIILQPYASVLNKMKTAEFENSPAGTRYNDQLKRNINPDEAVARGAGILAGILAGSIKGIQFHDITPHALGIEDDDENFICVLKAGTAYPVEASRLFTTTMDFQGEVFIHILQHVGVEDKKGLSLGWFELKTDPARKKGETNIDVTFSIDLNGVLKVSAVDIDTGEHKAIVIHDENGFEVHMEKFSIQGSDKTDENPSKTNPTEKGGLGKSESKPARNKGDIRQHEIKASKESFDI